MKTDFWKIFSLLGVVGNWASTALVADEDGVVRITIPELTSLAASICGVFGWKAEIVVDDAQE